MGSSSAILQATVAYMANVQSQSKHLAITYAVRSCDVRCGETETRGGAGWVRVGGWLGKWSDRIHEERLLERLETRSSRLHALLISTSDGVTRGAQQVSRHHVKATTVAAATTQHGTALHST